MATLTSTMMHAAADAAILQKFQAEKDAFKRMLDRKFPPHPAIVAKAAAARAIA